MAKDPAFLFYSQDFYMATAYWTDQQVGKYIRLMIIQHQNGIVEPEILESISCGDPKILAKFKKDENGNFYNEVLKSHVEKRKTFTESRRKNVKKRYDSTSVDTSVTTSVGTTDLHMENENENIIVEDCIKNKEDELFLRKDGENARPTIIADMVSEWVDAFPGYQLMPGVDFRPLREIAEFICDAKKIDFDVGSLKVREIVKIEFKKMVEFIAKDRFYNRQSISQLAKPANYQSVIQSMNNKKNGSKPHFNGNSGNPKQQQNDALNDLIGETANYVNQANTGTG